MRHRRLNHKISCGYTDKARNIKKENSTQMDNSNITAHINQTLDLSENLSGHLRRREVQLLAALPFVRFPGDILEIGSFKGKSTIILAKSAAAAGLEKIHACDPLSLSCETDPSDATEDELPSIFYGNLKKYNVNEIVEFHQMKSGKLAESWNNPLKILWIDGDHTFNGVMSDFTLFKPYLTPGSIVCFHDVLHGFDGPIRTFMESVLLSGEFGDCGICGSIGWSQYTASQPVTGSQWKNKLSLYRKLARLVPYYIQENQGIQTNKRLRKLYKSLVPHGAVDPVKWVTQRNAFSA